MPTTLTVYRDQAVWERETFEIEVPDHVPPDEYREFVEAVLDEGSVESIYTEILDHSVDSVDIDIEIVAINGVEQ